MRFPKLSTPWLWVPPPSVEPSGKADAERMPDAGALFHLPTPCCRPGRKSEPHTRLDVFWMSNKPPQTQPWALTWPWCFQTLKLDSNLGTYVKDRSSRRDKVRGPGRRVGRHSAATSFAGFPRPHLQHWFIREKNNSLFNIGHNIMTYNPQCFFLFFFHVFNPLSCSFWEH